LPPLYARTLPHPTRAQGNYVKNLNLLGRDLRTCIIVDNSPLSYLFHPENAVGCISWIDQQDDEELGVIQVRSRFAPFCARWPRLSLSCRSVGVDDNHRCYCCCCCCYLRGDLSSHVSRCDLPAVLQDFCEVIEKEEDVRYHMRHWRQGKNYDVSSAFRD